MIPKVSSLPSLQVRSVTHRAQQADNRSSSSRRRSFDVARRSNSRPGSCVDLLSLDVHAVPGNAVGISIPARDASPPPVWPASSLLLEPLIESPASFSASDALANMAKLSTALEDSRKKNGEAAGEPSVHVSSCERSATDPSSEQYEIASVSLSNEILPKSISERIREPVVDKATSVLSKSISECILTPDSAAAKSLSADGSSICKTRKTRVGPAARPGSNELRVYRRILQLDFVQEMLTNISHVQSMFRGVASAPASASAADAVSAAMLLSRSLTRAAARVRNVVRNPSVVHVSQDALFTLAEYGWVEVCTEDAEQAKQMGCVEADLYHLPSGRSTTWVRPAVDKAWTKVGDTHDVYLAAWKDKERERMREGNAQPPPSAAQTSVHSPDVAAVAACRGLFTLAALAEHLVVAGTSVAAGAELLQQWLTEQRTRTYAAVAGALPLTVTSSSCTPPTPTAQPVGHPIVVGFQPGAVAVVAGV